MVVETRVVNYVADGELYYFNQHEVCKCLELTPNGCLQPIFPRRRKLEFQIGKTTKEIAGGRGITCFESEATARHFMMRMRNNTGNLVVVCGIGYCFGDPPREHPDIKSRHSVLVRALKVEKILYSYDEIKKKGGETK